MAIKYKDLLITPMSGGYWAIERPGFKHNYLLMAWITKQEVRDFVVGY